MESSNDAKTFGFFNLPSASAPLPYSEGFEMQSFPPNGCTLLNPDNDETWKKVLYSPIGGFGNSSSCLYYPGVNNPIILEKDYFMLPPLDFSTVAQPALSFDLAYNTGGWGSSQTLEVLVSSDCGNSWTTVYNKSDSALITSSQAINVFEDFVPEAYEWRKEVVDVSAFTGQNEVLVQFKITNGYSSYLFIDNIHISQNTFSVSDAFTNNSIKVFPNPANELVQLSVESDQSQSTTITIYNSTGSMVNKNAYTLQTGKQTIQLNTEALAAGIYLIELKKENRQSSTAKLSVAH